MERVKKYSRNDIKNHNNPSSTWIIIDDKVYDVTKFLVEHPGGEETILDEAGKDATFAFNDAGHSSEAREMMKKYEIGELIDSEKTKKGFRCPKIFGTDMTITHAVIAVVAVVAVGAFITYRMRSK